MRLIIISFSTSEELIRWQWYNSI